MGSFTHENNAHNDPFLKNVAAIFGMEGIGRWWSMLEEIDNDTNEKGGCEVTLEVSVWCTHLMCKPKGLWPLLEYFEGESKIKLFRFENKTETKQKQTKNELTIRCDKLMELRVTAANNPQIVPQVGGAPVPLKNLSISSLSSLRGNQPDVPIKASGKVYLEYHKKTKKHIHKIVNLHKGACSRSVKDDGLEVKELYTDLLTVTDLGKEPLRTLAYVIQGRHPKEETSPVGCVYSLLANPMYAPSDESMKIAKGILSVWDQSTNQLNFKPMKDANEQY